MLPNNSDPHVYYPAVDGLRAIAVVAVVLYHVGAIIPAGFIGVDIFFVISGFVVASAATNLPSTTFSEFLSSFYARRVLRIVPALVVVILTSFAVDSMIVPDAWLSDANAKTGLAALFGLSNVFLAFTANDYWSPRTEFNPFTHTWSLGVEEQFYLIFPLLFFGWVRGRRLVVTGLLSALVVVSLGALYLVQEMQSRTVAFYSLPTRFWELGLGVLLFMLAHRWSPFLKRLDRALIEFFGFAALLLLGGILAWIDESLFPWPSALLPVLLSLLLIMLATTRPDCTVVCALASPLAVFLGKISYSLYLWHWPVVVFMKWTVGLRDEINQLLACVISVTLAWLSWQFVENPIRRSSGLKMVGKWRVVVCGVAVMTACAAFAGLAVTAKKDISFSVTSDDSVWHPDAVISVAGVDRICEVRDEKNKFASGKRFDFLPVNCSFESSSRVFVVGDSHAWAYSSMLRAYSAATGSHVSVFTSPGCSVFNLRNPTSSLGPACEAFVDDFFSMLKRDAQSGDILFLPSLRLPRFGDQWGDLKAAPQRPLDREASIAEAIQRLDAVVALGIRVVFEAPKPIFRVPLFRCSDTFNKSNPDCGAGHVEVPRYELSGLRAPVLSAMKEVRSSVSAVEIWDPFPLLCPNEFCSPLHEKRPMFFDGDHLTAYGNSVLAPSFRKALVR